MAYMVNRDAPYSGLATLMNMRDNNPNTQLAYVPTRDVEMRYDTIYNPSTGIPQAVGLSSLSAGGSVNPISPSYSNPIANKADEVASYGRYGDTTLVHMTPREVSGLASLGQLTINPDTGLPEAFSLGNIIPILANIALGVATGGMSAPMQMAVMAVLI